VCRPEGPSVCPPRPARGASRERTPAAAAPPHLPTAAVSLNAAALTARAGLGSGAAPPGGSSRRLRTLSSLGRPEDAIKALGRVSKNATESGGAGGGFAAGADLLREQDGRSSTPSGSARRAAGLAPRAPRQAAESVTGAGAAGGATGGDAEASSRRRLEPQTSPGCLMGELEAMQREFRARSRKLEELFKDATDSD
jgi:hypothetical protein